MSELPDEWEWAAIRDVTSPFSTVDPRRSPSETFRYVDIGSIDKSNQTITDPKTFLGRDAPSRARRVIRSKDVLFSTVRTYLKNIAQVPDELDGCLTSTGIAVLRAADDVDPRYLFHWVCSDAFVNAISLEQDGSLYPAVTDDNVGAGRIPVAPAPEQRRIVAKLDAVLAGVARARKELDHVPILIAHHKQALLAAAFSGELTRDWREAHASLRAPLYEDAGIDGRAKERPDLPAQWLWTSVGAVAQVTGGLTKGPKRNSIATQAPYLRVANVYANELRLDEVSSIGCTPAELAKTRLKSGDLLIVEGNGSLEQIGRVAIWNDEIADCSHQNHIIRARVNADLLPRYALYWMLSPVGRSFIENVASSSAGLHTLSISKIQGLPIPLCSVEEQAEIVRLVDLAFTWLDAAAGEHAHAAKLLPKLEQAILAKAFRGELVPQDPADEPAAVLLERIRVERAAASADPQQRKARGAKPPRAPEEKSAMTKSRFDPDVKDQPYLASLIRKEGGEADAEALFRRADLPVADFYKQLAWEVAAGHVRDAGEMLEAA